MKTLEKAYIVKESKDLKDLDDKIGNGITGIGKKKFNHTNNEWSKKFNHELKIDSSKKLGPSFLSKFGSKSSSNKKFYKKH